MIRRTFGLSLLAFGFLGLAACSASTDGTSPPLTPPVDGDPTIAQARSDKPRETKPNVAASDVAQLTSDGRDFAMRMFGELRKDPKTTGKNLFFSPHSIHTAFAMLYAGAQGSTETAMTKGLAYSLPQDRLHDAMNALDLALESRANPSTSGGGGADGNGFRLAIANSAWSQQGFSFEAPYLDRLAVDYGAGMSLLDFQRDATGAAKTINAWIEKKTENRIKDLVSGLPGDTKLVLANAVYFNAAWQQPFTDSATADLPFVGLTSTTTAKMMNTTTYGSFTNAADYDALALPYEGGQVELVAIAPKAGTFAAYEGGFDRKTFDAVVAGLQRGQVRVTMPRFEIAGDAVSLTPALGAMGMGEMFSDAANFRGITAASGFRLFDAVHKAFVKVDEKGTEAAAATAIMAGTTSVGPEPAVVKLDRPFLFAIRDVPTGAMLFLGRVLSPQ